jgi:hypothetical protein
MFVESRDDARQFFRGVWRKLDQRQVLSPLESIVADVIRAHPEYHPVLGSDEALLRREFDPLDGDHNPFLHMGLHIALAEQLASDRPPGIAAAYRALLARAERVAGTHALEHRVMHCLAEVLRVAAGSGRLPDEADYLARVRALAD